MSTYVSPHGLFVVLDGQPGQTAPRPRPGVGGFDPYAMDFDVKAMRTWWTHWQVTKWGSHIERPTWELPASRTP